MSSSLVPIINVFLNVGMKEDANPEKKKKRISIEGKGTKIKIPWKLDNREQKDHLSLGIFNACDARK